MRKILFFVLCASAISLNSALKAQTFDRTVQGSWGDGQWFPSGVPNASGAIANLVVPSFGIQNLNLVGGPWTVSQLNLTGPGGGKWVLFGGTVNSSGPNTIHGGTLQIGNGFAGGAITGDFVDNGTLVIDRSGFFVYTGSISGTGSAINRGPGILTLSGNNTYSGGTLVSAGAIRAGSTTALSSNSAFTVNSVIDLSGFSNTIGSLSGPGTISNRGATLAVLTVGTDNTSTTFDGIFEDRTSPIGLTKVGTGILTLAGFNDYSGPTNVDSGTLRAGSGIAFSPNSAFTVMSALDLNGFGNSIGSLSGNGLVTNNGAAIATLTVGFGNANTTFSGRLEDGAGVLQLNKIGTGTLTLTGNSAYSGGTLIRGGSLQIGNGGTTGSIFGNVNDDASLIFNRSDRLNFNGVISGTGSVSQNGAGTTVLSGNNTYAGGTVINAGSLVVNGVQALGLGDVVVNQGTLRGDPQPINVKGNYAQNAGGTLQLQVAGSNPGQYDVLNVGGHAALGGTLQLISLGFRPKGGEQLTLITAGGAISGRFARFVDPFIAGSGFSMVDLVYGRNSVLLQFLSSPVPPGPPAAITTIDFESFAQTANQVAAASLLDRAQTDPRAAGLISFLRQEPFAKLPDDFDKVAPTGLTALYEISFSGANIQKLNLESRLDDIRIESNGFSSNVKINNGAALSLEGRGTVDGKSSNRSLEPILQSTAGNRWGVWITGFGDFVNVDQDANAKGYKFTTGGISLGIDYRLADHLAVGIMANYSHTWTDLQPDGQIDTDTGRVGLYGTYFGRAFYLNGSIYGGYNSYDTSRQGLGGMATGSTNGGEFSTFIGGGHDFRLGQLIVGPIASLQYTDAHTNGFSENGSLAPLQINGDSQGSLRTDLGFRASFAWQFGKILVYPFIKAAWEHEFLYAALPITADFAGSHGPSATFVGPRIGHDSAVGSAGVSAQFKPGFSAYLSYDGQLGRSQYNSNAVTGGVRISF